MRSREAAKPPANIPRQTFVSDFRKRVAYDSYLKPRLQFDAKVSYGIHSSVDVAGGY